MKIAILCDSLKKIKHENSLIFTNGLRFLNHEVYLVEVNSVYTINEDVFAHGKKVDAPIYPGESLNIANKSIPLSQMGLVWVMNQPHKSVEKDVYQILWLLSQKVRFVNSLESIQYINNKTTFGYLLDSNNRIPVTVSNEQTYLTDYFYRKEENMILKLTNDGCGNGVFFLEQKGLNSKSLIQTMTGNADGSVLMRDSSLQGFQKKYVLLQDYVSEALDSEKRVILAGDKIVYFYRKTMPDFDCRANYSQGGGMEPCVLSEEEKHLCEKVIKKMKRFGLNYVGLDIAYPYVIEFNIVNPGGIADLDIDHEVPQPKIIETIESILSAVQV